MLSFAYASRCLQGTSEFCAVAKFSAKSQNSVRQRRGSVHFLSSQVNTLPKAKSKTRSKQNKDMNKCSSVYSEREVPLRF